VSQVLGVHQAFTSVKANYYGGRVQAMRNVRLTGWREGMRKISLTKFLQAELDLSLAASKQVVDDVPEGRQVLLDIPLRKRPPRDPAMSISVPMPNHSAERRI